MISNMIAQDEGALLPPVRRLPVLLLLDKSSSMSGDKIDSLNEAVQKMLEAMKSEREALIACGAIAFGSATDTKLILPLTPVEKIEWQELTAGGNTCLGQALDIAKSIVEDKEQMPGSSYKPTVVVVSDGAPNDEWQSPMQRFCHEGRSSKCSRWAMGIAAGADGEAVLRQFVSDSSLYFTAQDASNIGRFFQAVTMSTISRAKGITKTDISFGLGDGTSIRQIASDDEQI